MIQAEFPDYSLPAEIQSVLDHSEQVQKQIDQLTSESIAIDQFFPTVTADDPGNPSLLKQILLRYRRHSAARTESLREKTPHLGLTETLEEEIKVLDTVTQQAWFHAIESIRLPRAKDCLPIQLIEHSESSQLELAERQYDEKFHILQAPTLFLLDLAYFRAKCEMRETPLAVAFLDIDHFKNLNATHTETKIDRNLLPRFMQTIEGHIYHHGYAYRQGGDEYLILLPSLSRPLAIAFLEELREKLASLIYPDIPDKTTVSIGLCIADPECPFTDRELKARANEAEQFAKNQGRNCIATYAGSRFIPDELTIVGSQKG